MRIPNCFPELSTPRVLVMDLVVGDTLSEDSALGHPLAERRAQAAALLRSLLHQIMDDGVFHADLHPGNIVLGSDGSITLLDFGSVGRLDGEQRAAIGRVLMAFTRGDGGAMTEQLLGLVSPPEDLDEAALRRALGRFLAERLGPGARLDAQVFQRLVALLAEHGLAMPAELVTAFRAVAVLEGTLRRLDPGFDLLAEASALGEERARRALRPGPVRDALADEAVALLPILRALPRRVDRVLADLETGRLGMRVRFLADPRDRGLIRSLVHEGMLTLLACVTGIMATMLLVSGGGPAVTDSLTLYQLFGYLLLVLAGLFGLRVIFEIFRRPRSGAGAGGGRRGR